MRSPYALPTTIATDHFEIAGNWPADETFLPQIPSSHYKTLKPSVACVHSLHPRRETAALHCSSWRTVCSRRGWPPLLFSDHLHPSWSNRGDTHPVHSRYPIVFCSSQMLEFPFFNIKNANMKCSSLSCIFIYNPYTWEGRIQWENEQGKKYAKIA